MTRYHAYLALFLIVVFGIIYFMGGIFYLRILGYIMVAFGILVFLLAGTMEEKEAMFGGWPGGVGIAVLLFILGLVLIFLPG